MKGPPDEGTESGAGDVALLASRLWLPTGASASALSSGSGSFTATGEVISIRQADGNTIVTATEVQTLTAGSPAPGWHRAP